MPSPLDNEGFYENLPAVTRFSNLAACSSYQELPADWAVIVADIKNSTDAIRQGKYKAVNAVGVCVIAAVVNLAKPLRIPYVFGGDGASLCVPPSLVPAAREALKSARRLARESYGLELRAAIVPAFEIRKAGHRLLVAKFQISRYCAQAAFAGGGMTYAENGLKESRWQVEEGGTAVEADYSGLECRWKDIPSPLGETVALLVRAHPQALPDSVSVIYQEVLAQIESVYSGWPRCHPLAAKNLRLAFNLKKLAVELKCRSFGKGLSGLLRYAFQMLVLNFFGWVFMTFKISSGGVRWGDYKQQLIENADVRKFDDMLRLVIAGNSIQRKSLLECLEAGYRVKKWVYGAHVSGSALMTCLIRDYAGEHYHFIDGADGGYAAAAVELKRRLAKETGKEAVR